MRRIIAGPTVTGTATTADRSLTFSENIIPRHGSAVRRMHVTMTGTGMTLGNVTRLTLKANSQPVIDARPDHLARIFAQFQKRDVFASSQTAFTLPLDLFGGAAPAGALLRLEIEKNATPGASTATLFEELEDELPSAGYYMVLGSTQPLAANDTNRLINVPGSGALVGVVVPDAGNITLFRIRQSGDVIYDLGGASIAQVGQFDRGADFSGAQFVPIPGIPIVPGATQVEASANGSYNASDWTFLTMVR